MKEHAAGRIADLKERGFDQPACTTPMASAVRT